MKRTIAFFAIACATSTGVVLACSSTSSITTSITSIGPACQEGGCNLNTACGAIGIATSQCVESCSATGVAECPSGAFCTALGSDAGGHACLRTCASDTDCHAFNSSLSCEDGYADDGGATSTMVCSHRN